MKKAQIYPDLENRVAVVTGGSKGIGAATVHALAENGVHVLVSGREPEEVEKVAEQARELGVKAIGMPAEVSDPEAMDGLRDVAIRELGVPTLLFPFAGGFQSYTPLLEIEIEEWNEVMSSNLTGTFTVLKSFLPAMIDAGGGSVVTMSSNSGRQIDSPLTAPYAASKAGVIQLTRHAAYELADKGVRLNCIAPATTETERVQRNLSDELRAQILQRVPLGRLAQPEDSANAALFLASEGAAGYLTGITIDIAGGRIMV